MSEARIYASFDEVPRVPNSGLLTGAAESWEFYQAIANIPPPGFVLGAIAAGEGADGSRLQHRLLAQGRTRRAQAIVFRHAPQPPQRGSRQARRIAVCEGLGQL